MIQLQSILIPCQEVCGISELYYHKTDDRIDFNGYFNLFYIEKRKKYTMMEHLFLNISLQGYKELRIIHDGTDIRSVPLEAERHRSYQVEFPYVEYNGGVFWFALIEDETVEKKKVQGWFATNPAEECSREIHIGIDICTFKREDYVSRNLKQLRDSILKKKELSVSEHIKIFIIDNGGTLQTCESVQEIVRSCDGKAVVIPNKNAGGAGGFTRGMLEILKEKEESHFTHVLLMDDDAVVEPDTLVRVYGLLSILKPEWADITIGGTMLREDYPYMLFCAGEWWDRGAIINPKMHLDLRDLKQSTDSYLTGVGHEYDRYSGWWCCCYSLNVVRDDNLPIPLFFHHDDIEFGLRNREKGIVFINGIGVWHRGSELTFPGSNIYYDTRNNLIEVALHQEDKPARIARKLIFKSLTSAAIRLKYKDAEMVFRGLEDFLKGPEWLYRQDPDKLNTDVRAMAYPMLPIEEVKKYLSEKDCREVERQISDYQRRFGMDEIIDSRVRKSRATVWKKITYNGWLLPGDWKIKVIFPTDSPFETFRRRKVVLYDLGNQKGAILERRYGELLKICNYYLRTLFLLLYKFDRTVKVYRKNIAFITNKKAWKEYLEKV